MVKLCVFDMDGLLLDSERVLYLSGGMEVSKALGYPLSEEFLRSLMGSAWNLYEEKIMEKMGKDFPMKQYLDGLFTRIDRILESGEIPLRPGAKQLLDYCKSKGIRMAIATSTPNKQAIKCLKKTGLYDYFDYVVTGDMVEKGKPEPDIFLKAIDYFGIDKKNTLVLEDGHNGAQAAMKGCCRLILVEDVARVEQEDRDYSEILPKDLSEVIDYIEKENEGTFSI